MTWWKRDKPSLTAPEEGQRHVRTEGLWTKCEGCDQIIWRKADGTVTQESFAGETSFRSRLDEIYSLLEEDNWNTVGPPQLQRDGWRI